jgi:hypothetical protein
VKSISSRKLVIGAASLVLLGGAGGAVAVAGMGSSAGSSHQAYVEDLAKRLNVSPGALTAAMKVAGYDRIQAAVAAGRITRSQADAVKERIERGDGVSFFGRRLGLGGPGVHRAAAQYLGISAAALRNDVESGKSLAQIASSTPGKSIEGLKTAIVSAKKTRLDQAVSSGSVTSQQEQERLGKLSSRIEALVQRTGRPSRGPGFAPLGR